MRVSAFFASVRAPRRKIPLRAACARTVLLAAAGLLTGVVIQFLDRDSPVLGDVFSQMSVWIFFVHRAIRWQRHAPSRGRQRFCLSPAHGRSVLRHCRSAATPLFHDLCHRMGRLRVPVPAFRLFAWYARGKGPIAFLLRVGILAGIPLCALVLFDAIRIADILFALLTAALLFWPPKPAESSARKERRHAPPR